MVLNSYQRMCYKRLGKSAEYVATDKLKADLEKAHIEMRPGAYLSCVWFNTIIVLTISVFVFVTMILFFQLDAVWIYILILIPVLTTIVVYFIFINMPASKAKTRGKKIDLHLPYALNFISAMSSAGITPSEIFNSLSKQKIYGEIQEEALWIYRDVSLLGKDIISAIKDNIERTPSQKFKELLQGAIVTVKSGGSLKPYFMNKADQYMRENRIAQKQRIESLGILAECYVTAAVAGVLLIIIILPLMMLIAKRPPSDLIIVNIFALGVVPLIHFGFAMVLSSISARV